MKNLYVWFPGEEERRKFVLELLELGPNEEWYLNIEPFLFKDKFEKNRYRTNRREDFTHTLDMLDRGMYSSPYLNMVKRFSKDSAAPVGNLGDFDPWTAPVVFNKGFRKIYTKNSYQHRRGYWLVLQFQKNDMGRAKHDYVLKRIPPKYIGLNVPVTLFPAVCKLNWLERQFAKELDDGTAGLADYDRFFEYLCEVKHAHPELFCGKKIYLWEQLAALYSLEGEVEKSATCYLKWAVLAPCSSDPFLNLGVLYNNNGLTQKAIDAYKRGLELNPNDEYIFYNLASMMKENDKELESLRWINEAILTNPSRGVNYYLKGSAHMSGGKYSAAITSFKKALELYSEEWNPLATQTRLELATAYEASGKVEEAATTLKHGLESDSTNVGLLYKLARLLGDKMDNWPEALIYAKTALSLSPDCADIHTLLTIAYANTDAAKLAKWHAKKAEHIQRKMS